MAERSSYEIDEDGSFILWPSVDVHVNLEMLRESIDPEYRAASSREPIVKSRQTQSPSVRNVDTLTSPH